MLGRIWGRPASVPKGTSSLFLPVTTRGCLSRLAPLPGPSHRHWVLDSDDPQPLEWLAGMAILNGHRVRIHTPDDPGALRPESRMDPEPGLRPDTRRLRELHTRITGLLESWEQIARSWQGARERLAGHRFGAMDALDVLCTLIQQPSGCPTSLFRHLRPESFQWTMEEYRTILTELDNVLRAEAARHRSWLFDTLQLDPRSFEDLTPTAAGTTIHAWRQQSRSVAYDLQGLLSEIHDHFRKTHPQSFWQSLWQDVGRLSLTTAPTAPGVQAAIHDLETSLAGLEGTIRSSGWFLRWPGFQFITLEELDFELQKWGQRLDQLDLNLTHLIHAAKARQELQALNPVTHRILIQTEGYSPSEIQDSFTSWYLARWLERTTSSADWKILTDAEEGLRVTSELLQAVRDWMACRLQQDPRPARSGKPGSEPEVTNIWWHCSPTEDSYPDELVVIRLMNGSDSTVTWIQDLMEERDPPPGKLPAPLHEGNRFWVPELSFDLPVPNGYRYQRPPVSA